MFHKLLIAVFILLFVMFTYCAANEEIKNEESTYYSLFEKVKNFDKSVDFKTFRLLYAETSDYNPYDGDYEPRKAMYEAMKEKEHEKALKYARSILDKNYVDIDAHLICKSAYQKMNNSERYNFHQFVENGLINSILSSGDGKSPETAYLVINVKEEYAILNFLGFKLKRQSLRELNGHSYDEMEVINEETGETSVLYFNVDIPFGWLKRRFR